jgi:hypothetical protein
MSRICSRIDISPKAGASDFQPLRFDEGARAAIARIGALVKGAGLRTDLATLGIAQDGGWAARRPAVADAGD